MSYRSTLPNAFPYALGMGADIARRYVSVLLDESRTDVPDGSSFAVTVDAGPWTLWLSEVSYKFLKSKELWDEVEQSKS